MTDTRAETALQEELAAALRRLCHNGDFWVAAHEAGHAVAALAVGFEVLSASITGGLDYGGEVRTSSKGAPDTLKAVYRRLDEENLLTEEIDVGPFEITPQERAWARNSIVVNFGGVSGEQFAMSLLNVERVAGEGAVRDKAKNTLALCFALQKGDDAFALLEE